MARQQHHAVDGDGYEDQCDLDRPADPHRLQADGHYAGQHQAGRPPGMQHVEPLGLVSRIHRGDNGVDHGLDGAVAERPHERRPVQAVVAGGGDGHDRRDDVTGEREPHGVPVTKAVNHQAEQHDADGKGPEPGAKNLSQLRFAEAKFLAPITEHEGATDEPKRRRHQRHETSPEHVRAMFDKIECHRARNYRNAGPKVEPETGAPTHDGPAAISPGLLPLQPSAGPFHLATRPPKPLPFPA